MLRIAYCDDCKEDRDNIMAHLSEIEYAWKEEFCISAFEDGNNLCNSLEKNTYDIILLDIVMGDISGIEIAKRIRAMGEDSKIIFISSYDEKIRELFKFGTIAFIDKPINKYLFEEAMKLALTSLSEDKEKVFIYEKNKSKFYVSYKDIICFESNRNSVIIHTKKEKIQYIDSLKNVWTKVMDHDNFVMPSKSYVFNLKYVSIRNNCIYCSNNNINLNIGRAYKDDTINRYLIYMERRSY